MSQADFSDAALVVLGHGTTRNEDSGTAVFEHAAELRRRRLFAEVREGFWKQEPRAADVLGTLSQQRIFIAPLFVSEGYFSENIIPKALGFGMEGEPGSARVQRRGMQTLYYCRPAGTHARMTDILLARARGVVAQFPFPRAPQAKDLTLIIAGHGTGQDANSRRAVERQAERIRALDYYAAVETVFLEEEPKISASYELARTRHLVVVPFFVSDGLHVREDIPVLLGEPERVVKQRLQNGQATWRNPTEKKGKLVWYSAAAGTEPLMADLLLDCAREAVGWPVPSRTGALQG